MNVQLTLGPKCASQKTFWRKICVVPIIWLIRDIPAFFTLLYISLCRQLLLQYITVLIVTKIVTKIVIENWASDGKKIRNSFWRTRLQF